MTDERRGSDDRLLAELRALVGQESEPVPFVDPVATGDLRRYCNAVEDSNPLWLDDAYARRAGYAGCIAPPCLVLELRRPPAGADRMEASGLGEALGSALVGFPAAVLQEFGMARRGEDDVEWLVPARPGDKITLRQRVADVQLKTGSTGLLLFVGQVKDYYNQHGDLLVSQRVTSVRRRRVPGEAPLARREPALRPLPEPDGHTTDAPGADPVAVGDALPPLRFGPLSVVHTVRWAAFTENWYRLHYDREYVREHEGEPSFIASGGFRQALLCRMLTDWLGPHGRLRRLTIRQAYPTFEGHLFQCGGRVLARDEAADRPTLTCEVWAVNGDDRELLRGTAVVELQDVGARSDGAHR